MAKRQTKCFINISIAGDELTKEVLPKQKEFMESEADEVLYSGAWRAGKSHILCEKVKKRAQTPGAREFLCRKTMASLRRTTLKTLLVGDGGVPPVLRPEEYKRSDKDSTLYLLGEDKRPLGEIVYGGIENPQVIGSMSLSGVAMDEGVEFSANEYEWAFGRTSTELPGLKPQIYCACNPGPPIHHLARRFGLVEGSKAEPGCHAIQTSTIENYFLPDSYIEKLKRLELRDPIKYARFVLGRWVGSGNNIYREYDPSKHTAELDPRETGFKLGRVVFMTDLGAGIAVLYGVGGDNDIYIIAERWYERPTYNNLVNGLRELADLAWAPAPVICDPEDPGIASYCQRHKISIRPARGLRMSGRAVGNGDISPITAIRIARSYLEPDGIDQVNFHVSESCPAMVREILSYEWDTNPQGEMVPIPERSDLPAVEAMRLIILDSEQGNVRMIG